MITWHVNLERYYMAIMLVQYRYYYVSKEKFGTSASTIIDGNRVEKPFRFQIWLSALCGGFLRCM
jgi:hypothetical protein